MAVEDIKLSDLSSITIDQNTVIYVVSINGDVKLSGKATLAGLFDIINGSIQSANIGQKTVLGAIHDLQQGGGGGGSSVSWSQLIATGTKIAEITINGVTTDVYAPTSGGASYTDVTGTLTAGQTSITLQDASILTTSTIDIYTDAFGVNPTGVTVAAGSVTLTFEAQATNVAVKVRVW